MARAPHPMVMFAGAALVAAGLGLMVPPPELRVPAAPSWRARYHLPDPLPQAEVVQYWSYEPRGTPAPGWPPGLDPAAERRRILAEIAADNRAYARMLRDVAELRDSPEETLADRDLPPEPAIAEQVLQTDELPTDIGGPP